MERVNETKRFSGGADDMQTNVVSKRDCDMVLFSCNAVKLYLNQLWLWLIHPHTTRKTIAKSITQDRNYTRCEHRVMCVNYNSEGRFPCISTGYCRNVMQWHIPWDNGPPKKEDEFKYSMFLHFRVMHIFISPFWEGVPSSSRSWYWIHLHMAAALHHKTSH